MTANDVFIKAMASRELPDPFIKELRGLRAISPMKRLDGESVRLKKLEVFDSARKTINPAYRAALSRSDWPMVANMAEKLLAVAKSLSLCAALWISLASSASAQQTLPYDIKDTAVNENLLYLDQQIRSLTDDGLTLEEIEASSPTFSGLVSFSNGLFSSSMTTNMTDTLISVAGICVDGSTITWPCPGANVQVIYSGDASCDSANYTVAVNFLLDGAYPYPWSNSIGITAVLADTTISRNASFSPIISVPPGTHKYCLTGFSTGGALAYIPGNARANLPTRAQFGVLCLP